MKKIVLSTFVLFAFSASIILFQISCKKEARADTSATTTTVVQQNKIIYVKPGTAPGGEVWTANYDGTNAQKININLPTGLGFMAFVKISPDHKTLFLSLGAISTGIINGIYSCNIDGSNLVLVTSGNSTIADAY